MRCNPKYIQGCGPALFFYVKENSYEWTRMWNELKIWSIKNLDTKSLQGWGYLQSSFRNGHSFRHRYHPKNKSPEYYFVKLGTNFDIEREDKHDDIIEHNIQACGCKNAINTF